MPIWFEVIALMLVAYLIGLTIGFTLWGRGQVAEIEDTKEAP
ncbi:DNA-directed RNA polymerase subunit beta [Qipengyuania flava]|nr:DNA-directed RNA polymerase subunit beta [Qipengyuania aestuarii]MBX7535657.1 DNA-directed RNA polymerase subunit beta [Qipengyuania aestuarii]MCA0978053.1 DNA-directed RNA polymerase subunit beta [Qipengyuania flava]